MTPGSIHQWLKDAYVAVAINNAEEFPSHVDLRESGPMADLASSLEDDWDSAHEEEGEGSLRASGLVAAATKEEVRRAFDDLRAFHRPFSKTLVERPTAGSCGSTSTRSSTALSRYPVLMRLLGLVHDLEVPHPGNLGHTTVQVLGSWTPASGSVETCSCRGWGHPRRCWRRAAS